MSVAVTKHNFIRIGYIETETCTFAHTAFSVCKKIWIKNRFMFEIDMKIALFKIMRTKKSLRAHL